MNKYIIKSQQPNCTICGKTLSEWNPFEETHQHTECLAMVIANNIMNSVRDKLNLPSSLDDEE